MRNYRASRGKWQTADPIGYPDGWNALAYCGNGVTGSVDLWGTKTIKSNQIDEHYDEAVQKSDYIMTSWDYEGKYNLYWDYFEMVHHSEYDLYEIDDSFFSYFSTATAITAITSFLSGCALLAGAAASAYVGAVPVTLVCLGAGKACITAAGGALSLTITGAVFTLVDEKITATMNFVEHIDEKETIVFGGKFRKEYFE